MMCALADKMILFSGKPGIEAWAATPAPVAEGFNAFLKDLNVTFRRDPTNHRPRINKPESVKDREQKASGHYYYFPDRDEKEDKDDD
jgi:ATP-binding cassette subfamily E protein 1